MENVTMPELLAEIETAKHELAERRVHLDEAEEKLEKAMHVGYFEEQSSLDIFIEKEELANRCALLESRVDALQQRLTDAQERASRAENAEVAERLQGARRAGMSTRRRLLTLRSSTS